jgi:maltooligosyltrehalose trehalohydrolase
LVNLGKDLPVTSLADPLLAPPVEYQWSVIWSSEDLAYGGAGTPPIESEHGVTLPAECAVVLSPTPI